MCRRSLPNQQPQRSTTISIASVTSRAYEPSCCRSQKAQKVVFAVLSCCSCVFETRSLLCCLGGAARIRLDGAILGETDRERQDNNAYTYLSIACRASEVTYCLQLRGQNTAAAPHFNQRWCASTGRICSILCRDYNDAGRRSTTSLNENKIHSCIIFHFHPAAPVPF